VSRLSGVFGKLDESLPLASILDRRSAGIKDLSAGYLLDDDWRNDFEEEPAAVRAELEQMRGSAPES